MVANGISDGMLNFWNQLASISYATQALFLGTAALGFSAGGESLKDTRPAGQPSFLELPTETHGAGVQFLWGDVLKGIEEMSHNVTAALLTLQLGNMSSECFFDRQDVVYRYSSVALWVPYGVSNVYVFSCYDLIFSLRYLL